MPKIAYRSFNFRPASLKLIGQANEIILNYQQQGFSLTLRQLYYQFVSRGLLENKDRNYKLLGSVVNDARLAGMIDWDAIEDRTRGMKQNSHWDTPEDILHSAASGFAMDSRIDQRVYMEVWVEKDALVGVLQHACHPLDVPYLSCRGYVSQSACWEAARRFRAREDHGRETVLIHLGDHDPSGIDMTRDIQDRLTMFGAETKVRRIALSMEQVQQYNPPPNPAKVTDSRFKSYQSVYGDESWELDALDPKVITGLITQTVNSLTERKKQTAILNEQEEERKVLTQISDQYEAVKAFLADNE